MKLLLTLALILITSQVKTQELKKIFLDKDFKTTKIKSEYKYYRTIQKTDSGFVVHDYFLNDQLQMSGLFSDPELKIYNGLFTWFEENGIIHKKATYTNDKLNGHYQTFSSEGNLSKSGFYVNGIPHGEFLSYHKDGTLKLKTKAVNGNIQGEYITYFQSGSINYKLYFEQNKLLDGSLRFYENGDTMSYLKINSNHSGTIYHYYENNILKEKIPLFLGYIKGNHEFYNENGELVSNKRVDEYETLQKKAKSIDVKFENHERIKIHFFKRLKEPVVSEVEKIKSKSGKDISKKKNDKKVKIKEEDLNLVITDSEAEFVGGSKEMSKYISTNINYPSQALKKKIQGKVYIKFMVDIDGSISNVEMERGNEIFKEESIRVIENMPDWIPGEMNGIPCKTWARIPINYKLSF